MKNMNEIKIQKYISGKRKTCLIVFLALLLFIVGQGDNPRGFRFAGGISSKGIPVQVFDNIVSIPVQINRSLPLNFILDTGASFSSYLDEIEAGKLKLALGPKSS
ncbi:MAG: hypothetical protein QG591_2999, partial [Planctomycetota bacterium]|nr:hypothetical protein [Planctomycetota bacterium]